MIHTSLKLQLNRLRRYIQQLNRRQWIMIGLSFCCLSTYSWIKTYQFDGGLIMEDMQEPRPLAEFRIKPWKVEKVLKNGVCGLKVDSLKWGMVTLVKSALSHRDRRDAIRATWARLQAVDDVIFQAVFIVGDTQDHNQKLEIKKESKMYGDILMYNLPDTRRFLSDKIIAGMQWSSENLVNPWLYSSTDDDFLLHPPHLAKYFTELLPKYKFPTKSAAVVPIICVYNYQWWDSPDRDPYSKWFCSKDLYPGWYWPRYCRGGMYTMTSSMVTRLFGVSRRTPYLHLDDVWITGLMRWKLRENDSNIIPAPMSQRYYRKFLVDQDPQTALVQHMWGNVRDLKEVTSVPDELTRVWTEWTNYFPPDSKICHNATISHTTKAS